MIRSMTGFGSAAAEVNGAQYLLEVRSLNNKYYKSLIRLPEELQGLEAELDSALTKRLRRGSVIATIKFSDTSADAAARINIGAIQRYVEQLMNVPGMSGGQTHIDLAALVALPGVVVDEAIDEKIDQARGVLLKLVEEACDKLIAMRVREGRTLQKDLEAHEGRIGQHLDVVSQRVPQVVEQYQQRLLQRMQALLAETGAAIREEDVIREVAVYAERSDIAEEVARLQGHLEQFREIIERTDEEPVGRTLDFLSQEMLREANTIASKCMDVEISRQIVEIKSAIDRIKEQVQNVE